MYHGTIIQIDDCLVSEEVLTEYFACDYEKCKGCCCVIGDSGAPMEECEAEAIEKNYHIFSPPHHSGHKPASPVLHPRRGSSATNIAVSP